MLNRLTSGILAIACIGLAIALLRTGAAVAPAASSDFAANVPAAPPDDAGLSRPIREIRFDNVGLNEVLESLSQSTGTNIAVDWQSLEGAGVDRAAPVNVALRNVTVGQVLTAIESSAGGRNAKLAHRAAAGVITVATSDELGKDYRTEIYDVRELLDDMIEDRLAALKKAGQPVGNLATFEEQMEQLEKILTDLVDHDTWRSAGGQGGSMYELGGLLIISATPEDQRDIALLLRRIHDALKRHEPLPTTMPAPTRSG